MTKPSDNTCAGFGAEVLRGEAQGALKAGDRVLRATRGGVPVVATLLAIHGRFAWIHEDIGIAPMTAELHSLVKAPQ